MKKFMMLFVAVVFMFGMVMPAAADTSFYGQVWFFTAMQDVTPADDDDLTTPVISDDDLVWEQDAASSRFGARFSGDVVSANVEIRPLGGSQMRHWNATWNLGGGKSLMFGQGWAPDFIGVAAKIKAPGIGNMDGDLRIPMIAFNMPAGPAKLTIAATEVNKTTSVSGYTATGTLENDVSMPKLFVKADIPVGPVSLLPFFGMKSYDIVDHETGTANETTIGIDSSAMGLNVTAKFGPATIKGTYWQATNGGLYAAYVTSVGPRYYDNALHDSEESGMGVSVAFKANDMITLQGGYGVLTSEVDTSTTTTYEIEEDLTYVNAVINLAKGVELAVYYEMYDKGEEVETNVTPNNDRGETDYYGARWILRF